MLSSVRHTLRCSLKGGRGFLPYDTVIPRDTLLRTDKIEVRVFRARKTTLTLHEQKRLTAVLAHP